MKNSFRTSCLAAARRIGFLLIVLTLGLGIHSGCNQQQAGHGESTDIGSPATATAPSEPRQAETSLTVPRPARRSNTVPSEPAGHARPAATGDSVLSQPSGAVLPVDTIAADTNHATLPAGTRQAADTIPSGTGQPGPAQTSSAAQPSAFQTFGASSTQFGTLPEIMTLASDQIAHNVDSNFENLDVSAVPTTSSFDEAKPTSTDQLVPQAIAALQANQVEQAIALLNQATASSSRSAEAYFILAMALARNNQLTKAMANFDIAANLAPHQASIFFQRGSLLIRMEENRRAETSFTRAIELEPQEAGHYVWRGLARLKMERPRPALEDAEEAIQRNASLPDAHFLHFLALMRLSRFAESRAAYQRAVSLGLDAHYKQIGENFLAQFPKQ